MQHYSQPNVYAINIYILLFIIFHNNFKYIRFFLALCLTVGSILSHCIDLIVLPDVKMDHEFLIEFLQKFRRWLAEFNLWNAQCAMRGSLVITRGGNVFQCVAAGHFVCDRCFHQIRSGNNSLVKPVGKHGRKSSWLWAVPFNSEQLMCSGDVIIVSKWIHIANQA